MKKFIFVLAALCLSSCSASQECVDNTKLLAPAHQKPINKPYDRECTYSVSTLSRTDIQDFDVF